jgi:type I restriction enzyme S subunit
MTTFCQVKIKDLCEKVSSGGTPSRKHSEYYSSDEGHLWVKSKELLERGICDTEEKISDEGLKNSSAKYYPANSVLVAMYGVNAGQLAWLEKPATVNQAICALMVDPKKADWQYVYYSLLESRQGLISQARGAAQPNLNKEMVENFEISLHSDLLVQKRISTMLSAYDYLIENNSKRIKTLEEMAKLLYEEWFVKFNFPGHENVKMVDSGTEYGMIPEGWKVSNLGEFIELLYGKALKEENRIPGNVLVCGSGGVVGTHNQRIGIGPGIIVGRKGNAGSVFWVNDDYYPIDTSFYVKTKLELSFVYYLLKTQNFVLGDAAVPGLNREQAYRNKILISTVEMINLFSEKASPLRQLIGKLENKNNNLLNTRDLLIPQLVTGKREIKN